MHCCVHTGCADWRTVGLRFYLTYAYAASYDQGLTKIHMKVERARLFHESVEKSQHKGCYHGEAEPRQAYDV